MSKIIEDIRNELIANSNEETRNSTQRFFKNSIQCYGIKSAVVTSISKDYFKKIKDYSVSEIVTLCDELWESGILEETLVICNWTFTKRKSFTPTDFNVFENWIDKNITNWATCDTFCNHTVGEFIEMYPHFLPEMKRWAKSKNLWMRRAAAVSLIVPARKGKFLNEIFEIADILLLDSEDMVQKGYGWMLKVASQKHLHEVYSFVNERKSFMPRTSLRYAIEKMPDHYKQIAMSK